MRIINFDEHFQQYTAQWVQAHGAEYGNNYDRMEEKMPEVYLQWLNAPADWLDGEAPGTYFAQFDDAAMLVDWLRAYAAQAAPIPDQLMERITDLGEPGEAALLALLMDDAALEEARLTAITLLSEMESQQPMAAYIAWIAGRREGGDTRAEMAAEALTAMGRCVVPHVLAAADGASPLGLELFVDVLCNFPGDEGIYALALRMFQRETDKRALYASLLGKLGDARALDALREAMDDPEITYLDYIELRNAIEALGGDAPPERAFDGDPYYESLRRMD